MYFTIQGKLCFLNVSTGLIIQRNYNDKNKFQTANLQRDDSIFARIHKI